MVNLLWSGVVITRTENGTMTKELYHDQKFAEIYNDHLVSLWDFRAEELTLIDHELKIYTTVSRSDFEQFMNRQNEEQIQRELQSFDEERLRLTRNATLAVYNRIKPQTFVADTLLICGYQTFEYHILNHEVMNQKIWISPSLQARINLEVNNAAMKKIEKIFKDNRERYFTALGIELDPITIAVEQIENAGYIMKRTDYGLREKADPEHDQRVESSINEISAISEWKIDPAIFTYHTRYQELDFNSYQIAQIKKAEKQLLPD